MAVVSVGCRVYHLKAIRKLLGGEAPVATQLSTGGGDPLVGQKRTADGNSAAASTRLMRHPMVQPTDCLMCMTGGCAPGAHGR